MNIGIFGSVKNQGRTVLIVAFPVVHVNGVYYKARWHRNRWVATGETTDVVTDYVKTVKRLPKVEL